MYGPNLLFTPHYLPLTPHVDSIHTTKIIYLHYSTNFVEDCDNIKKHLQNVRTQW